MPTDMVFGITSPEGEAQEPVIEPEPDTGAVMEYREPPTTPEIRLNDILSSIPEPPAQPRPIEQRSPETFVRSREARIPHWEELTLDEKVERLAQVIEAIDRRIRGSFEPLLRHNHVASEIVVPMGYVNYGENGVNPLRRRER